jgi:hypothetical protein
MVAGGDRHQKAERRHPATCGLSATINSIHKGHSPRAIQKEPPKSNRHAEWLQVSWHRVFAYRRPLIDIAINESPAN